jgi:hypothetical protein
VKRPASIPVFVEKACYSTTVHRLHMPMRGF